MTRRTTLITFSATALVLILGVAGVTALVTSQDTSTEKSDKSQITPETPLENNIVTTDISESQPSQIDTPTISNSEGTQAESADTNIDTWTGEITLAPLNADEFEFYPCSPTQPLAGMHTYQRTTLNDDGNELSVTMHIDNQNLFAKRDQKTQEVYQELYNKLSQEAEIITITSVDTLIYPFNCEQKFFDYVPLQNDLVYTRRILDNGVEGYYRGESFYFVDGSNIVSISAQEPNLNNRELLTFDKFNQVVSQQIEL